MFEMDFPFPNVKTRNYSYFLVMFSLPFELRVSFQANF